MRKPKGKAGELLLALHDTPGRYAAVVDPKLLPGDHVKLGFRADPMAPCESEWMWVEVTAVEGVWPATAVYRGELANVPYSIDPGTLRLGQPVEFGGEHIHTVVHNNR
jgi:hypothetical protein